MANLQIRNLQFYYSGIHKGATPVRVICPSGIARDSYAFLCNQMHRLQQYNNCIVTTSSVATRVSPLGPIHHSSCCVCCVSVPPGQQASSPHHGLRHAGHHALRRSGSEAAQNARARMSVKAESFPSPTASNPVRKDISRGSSSLCSLSGHADQSRAESQDMC